MPKNAILQFQTDKYMMFLLVIAMGSSLLHCSMDGFSKVNGMRIKVVLIREDRLKFDVHMKKNISVIRSIALMLLRKRFINK